MANSSHQFVSASEYAKLMGCSTRTVLRYIESGELKAHKLGPKIIRIDLAEALNG